MNNEKIKINNEFYTVEDLRKGYDTITGCNNKEMTDQQIIQYMTDILNEDNKEDREPTTAQRFINAIKTIATKPNNLDNLESYLSRHFQKWLERYANDPESITAEIENFANMKI